LKNITNTGIKNITNLLSFDLKQVNCKKSEVAIIEIDGKKYERNRIRFDSPEFDLFDELIFHIKPDSASFVFRSFGNIDEKLESLEELTNKIYDLLKDKTVGGTGKFKAADLNQIKKFDFWSGKLWIDHKNQSSVMIDYTDGMLRLCINV